MTSVAKSVSPPEICLTTHKTNWGIEINVDEQLSQVSPDDYDALVLPGGVFHPDKPA